MYEIRRSKGLNFAMALHRELIGTDPYKDISLKSNVWYAKKHRYSLVPSAYATSLDSIRDGWSYLNSCGVRVADRGQGLQKRLIRVRLRHAKAKGLTPITYTLADNCHSINNLIACGFKAYNPAFPWVGDSNVVYWIKH